MTKRVLLISFKKKRAKLLTNGNSCCNFAIRVFIILKSNLQTPFCRESRDNLRRIYAVAGTPACPTGGVCPAARATGTGDGGEGQTAPGTGHRLAPGGDEPAIGLR